MKKNPGFSILLSFAFVALCGCMEEEELFDAELEADAQLEIDAELTLFVGHDEVVSEEIMEQVCSEISSLEQQQQEEDETLTTCTAAGTCAAMDVHVYGSGCSPKPYNGIYWDGTNCRGAYGCNCDGADCGDLFENSYAGADCCEDTYYTPCNI